MVNLLSVFAPVNIKQALVTASTGDRLSHNKHRQSMISQLSKTPVSAGLLQTNYILSCNGDMSNQVKQITYIVSVLGREEGYTVNMA